MARRPNAAVGVVCPRCGMLAARIIGRIRECAGDLPHVRRLRPHVRSPEWRTGLTTFTVRLYSQGQRAKCSPLLALFVRADLKVGTTTLRVRPS